MDKLVVIYTLPMVSNISQVILVMATLACAIITPAAGALLLLPSPSVFAQQQEETSLGEREELGSGIASNVLDSLGVENEDDQEEGEENDGAVTGNDDDGSTNTQIAVPITDQDQRDANLAEQLGLNAEILEEEEEVIPTPTPSPTPEEEEEDTTPPTLAVPQDIVTQATDPQGAVTVRYAVSATDNVDGTAVLAGVVVPDGTVTQDNVGGDITISCNPPSGSRFPVGTTTTVTCTATDEAGNTATETFTITVQDTLLTDFTPPTLLAPDEDIEVFTTSTAGAVVRYIVVAQDNVDGTAVLAEDGTTLIQDTIGGDITIFCTSRSGSLFPLGTTPVDCTAIDEADNRAREAFLIIVRPI